MKANMFVFVIAVAVVCAPRAGFTEEAKTPVASDQNPTRVDYERLVNSLENKNTQPPIIGNEYNGRPFFPMAYNWDEQTRVLWVLDAVYTHPVESWQYLIDNAADSRYCLTVDRGGFAYNFSVGDVCKIVLRESLTAGYMKYIPKGALPLSWLGTPPITGSDQFVGWLRKRQNENTELYELQIEFCEWAIEVINSMAKEDSEKPSHISEMDRNVSVKKIKERIAELRVTKAPCVMETFVLRDVRGPYSRKRAEVIRKLLEKD